VALKTQPQPELISISEIAKRVKLDRATVRSRLDDLGYEPDPSSTAKNQLYPFDGEMEFAVKAAKDTLTTAKIRDMRATYELKELKLAEARGELVPMAEVIDLSQRLVGAMYKEFAIHQPKRLAARLAKCKSAAEASKVMKSDTEKFMAKLRGNFEEVLT